MGDRNKTVKLHERNRNFAWRDARPPFRVISPADAQQWNEGGFFVLRNALPRETVDRITAILDPLDADTEAFLATQENGRRFISRAGEITFTVHPVKKDAYLRRFVTSELFANLCLDLVGNDARLYWDQAVYKKPGMPEEFPWHQDNGYTYVEPQDYVTCWIPLTDATVANGCPWVMPGVHRRGTLDHWLTELGFECLDSGDGAVAVAANAGDIIVFSSLTPHRTGPNLTDGVRKAYIVQYSHDPARAYPRDMDRELFQEDPTRQFVVARGGVPVPLPD